MKPSPLRPVCPWRTAALALFWLAIAASAAAAEPLRIGTSGDYPPFSTMDGSGARRGFDVELAQRLAHDLGRDVVFVGFRWPELGAALRAGRFDLVASGVTIRADRLLAGCFTRPYARSGAVALVLAADAVRLHPAAELDRPGTRIAVNRGGHLEAVARAFFPHAQIETTDDNRSLGERIAEGRADAVITDTLEAPHILRVHPNLAALPPLTRDRKALYVPSDQPDLLHVVDRWLAAREADGWLNQLRQRWMGPDAEIALPRARIEAVVALVEERLSLMPYIAATKRRHGRAVEDRAQEKRVLDAARAGAARAGLDPEPVASLFAVLIETAKAVQRTAPAVPPAVGLDPLRSALGDISERLIAEIAADRDVLADPKQASALRESLSTTEIPGLDAAMRERLAKALAHAAVHP